MNKLSVGMTKSETVVTWCYLIFQLLLLPVILVFANVYFHEPFNEAQINFIFFAINFIVVTTVCHKFLIASAKRAFAAPFRCVRWVFGGITIYWLMLIVLGLFMQNISPEHENLNDSSIAQMAQGNFTLISVGTVLLVPIVEEVFYRGLIFRPLYNRSPIAAYCVSAVVFSAIHLIGYIGLYSPLALLISFLQYLPAGISLGLAYTKTDTIFTPILMHMTINWIGISAMR